jgi:hypothetical protein
MRPGSILRETSRLTFLLPLHPPDGRGVVIALPIDAGTTRPRQLRFFSASARVRLLLVLAGPAAAVTCPHASSVIIPPLVAGLAPVALPRLAVGALHGHGAREGAEEQRGWWWKKHPASGAAVAAHVRSKGWEP